MSGIELTITGPVARITLNRPDVHNSLTIDDLKTFAEYIEVINQNTDIRAAVITGAGEKSFCAGVSLGEVSTFVEMENPLMVLCNAIEEMRVPSLCMLNGGCYGGAAEIALACDFRVGVPTMNLCVMAVKLGVHYEAAGIRRAITQLGMPAAKRMYLMAERFDAGALVRINFLDDIVDADELEEHADKFASDVLGLAPLAIEGMKITMTELAKGTLDAAAASKRVKASWQSDDHAEAMAAMKEKRAPQFGRS